MVIYSGMLDPIQSEEDLALIIGHEMSHALYDYNLNIINKENTKNTLKTAAHIGALGLNLFGLGEVASTVRTVTNIADICPVEKKIIIVYSSCENPVSDDDNFCTSCGTKL